jgi:HD-GYP domain-containing protein (c-di-GMP phosphodiesterase class II)
LAELVAALSLGIDLGFGQPMEHVLRQCLIATRVAAVAGLSDDQRADVYYTSLVVNVGCHTDAHEQAKWFGDDIALKATKYQHEWGTLRSKTSGLRLIGSGKPALQRFRTGLEFAVYGYRDLDKMIQHHADMATRFARTLNLRDSVCDAVAAAYEQWDGKGWPAGLAGADVPIAARVSQLAEFVEVAHRVGGIPAARELARVQRGRQFDPALCSVLIARADEVLCDLGDVRTWDAVIAAEPALAQPLDDDEFDAALTAIADFIDLKSPFMLGHARSVAALAGAAAEQLNLPAEQARMVRRAGLALGFGRLGISNAIWDRPGPLGMGELERVRLSPYLTERMLRQSPALAPLGAIALQVRERMDGSGYPRGLPGSAISPLARILAAADAYCAMREPRPYRPARTASAAAAELREDVRRGRLEEASVRAVLAVAGHQVPKRREGPAGLTEREIEVLRLLARGLSNKQIGEQLVISPKTAGNHVEHIYAKIDASSRAAAGLFAMQQGLLAD